VEKERDPNRIRAKEIWVEHDRKITNRRIAELLGVDEKKIAVWKQRDKWNVVQQPQESVVQQSDTNVVQQKKIGAPKGNKNAVGNKGGAPKGSKNALGNSGGKGGPQRNKKALKTGEHETIWLDALEEDERFLYEEMDTDPLVQVDSEIRLFTIRERRMLLAIRDLMNGLTEKGRRTLQERKATKEPITIHDEKSGKTTIVTRERFELVVTELEETEARKIDDILLREEALTRVQDKKAKWVDMKYRMEAIDEEKLVRIEKLKAEVKALGSGGSEPVKIVDDIGSGRYGG
jgi:uncharacterized protein YjcR